MSEQSASEKRRRTKSTLTKKKKKNSRNRYKINLSFNLYFQYFNNYVYSFRDKKK